MIVRFRCMQYCRGKLLYTPSTTPLNQPHPVTRGLQSSTAKQPSQYTALYVNNLYITPLVLPTPPPAAKSAAIVLCYIQA
eukprot:7257856-Prymnesium_polylepis.1